MIIRWIVLFTILRRPYGYEEKAYLTQGILGLSETKWVSYFSYEK